MQGSKAGTGPKSYYRCRQIMATNLGKHRLTRHRSALPANLTSSRPRSWSLGNATLVVAERSGWRRVLGTSKPRPSAKGAHRYRKRACLEALRLATIKLTQRGTGYPSWGHPTQLRISRESTGLIHKEGEQLEDRRSVGESSCNSGDGTGQRVQSLMFLMMMIYKELDWDGVIVSDTSRPTTWSHEKVVSMQQRTFLTSALNGDG